MNDQAMNSASAKGTGQDLMETVRSSLSDYKTWLPEVALYGGVAFLVGFLVKNFWRFIILSSLVILTVVLLLNFTGVMTVTLQQVMTTINVTDVTTVQELYTAVIGWSKTHVIGAVSMVVGFLVGWKLG